MPHSVLDRQIQGDTETVEEAMIRLLPQDSRVSPQDVMKYVAMGERIMHALDAAPNPLPSTGLTLQVGGQTYKIEPNLETTRAISWYLQAKALSDNDGHGEPHLLMEGAMVAKDPGNKLYSFLRSSDNAYGRVSTHMQERSDSVTGGWSALVGLFRGGFAAMGGAGFSGQPLQYGIEDFDRRMPSKGGSLLFDKLKSSDPGGEPEIYLKWESSGTPNSFGFFGTHANHSLGDKLWNRGVAIGRSIAHTVSFTKDANPEGYRGEKMDKGSARVVLDEFTSVVRGLGGIDARTKDRIISHVKTYGATEMARVIDRMLDSEELRGNEDGRQGLERVLGHLRDWSNDMGAPLGIARKGGEVHVRLT
jgi:hypothetical protein